MEIASTRFTTVEGNDLAKVEGGIAPLLVAGAVLLAFGVGYVAGSFLCGLAHGILEQ